MGLIMENGCCNTFSFLRTRCTVPKELPAGVQEDAEPPLQGVCACLHPSLRQHLQHGRRGPHQYLLQALLLLHLRVQPYWSLWAGAPGETIAWLLMCEGEERQRERGLSVSLSQLSVEQKISAALPSMTSLRSMLSECIIASVCFSRLVHV